jgi:hypothetical protein
MSTITLRGLPSTTETDQHAPYLLPPEGGTASAFVLVDGVLRATVTPGVYTLGVKRLTRSDAGVTGAEVARLSVTAGDGDTVVDWQGGAPAVVSGGTLVTTGTTGTATTQDVVACLNVGYQNASAHRSRWTGPATSDPARLEVEAAVRDVAARVGAPADPSKGVDNATAIPAWISTWAPAARETLCTELVRRFPPGVVSVQVQPAVPAVPAVPATAPATNWVPWVVGGAAVVAAIALWYVMRDPEASDDKVEPEREPEPERKNPRPSRRRRRR